MKIYTRHARLEDAAELGRVRCEAFKADPRLTGSNCISLPPRPLWVSFQSSARNQALTELRVHLIGCNFLDEHPTIGGTGSITIDPAWLD